MTKVGVVIPAAGKGERAKGKIPKQFQEIVGVPMLLRTLRPFSAHPLVEQIVVALPADVADDAPEWLATLIGERLHVVPGGATRADSVYSGLMQLRDECDTVVVHDAARPFVSRETIDAVIEVAGGGLGAVACVPVTDTLKRTVDGTSVVETVNREGLWRAQTPQGFPLVMLRAAYDAAGAGAYAFTDEGSIAEAMGADVRIVPDAPLNFKVTTPEDFLIAEALAER